MKLEHAEYQKFIEEKQPVFVGAGFNVEDSQINRKLFDFQRACVRWALKKGRASLFEDCGLGKTPQQLEWARLVSEHTRGDVLIVAPLAVSTQTIREGLKFDVPVSRAQNQSDIRPGINITNYERLDNFDLSKFSGIVLDESSILKSYSGKIRNQIIENSKTIPYRLACTATPSPNDFMELGNHSEFCGVLTRTEMLSSFFINDSSDTGKWRLKGHAESEFWKWVCSWAVMIRKPSDIGFDDDGFILPPLEISECSIRTEKKLPGNLFVETAQTLMDRRAARRETIEDRCARAADIANKISGPVLVWCDLNAESELLTKLIRDAVEIRGSSSPDHKEKTMIGFSNGDIRVLVTKPSIAGFGMNWQHCSNMIFVGLSDSYEQYYQATRRCWRFGQQNSVSVYLITADIEGAVLDNIKRKDADANHMANEMAKNMSEFSKKEISATSKESAGYIRSFEVGDGWELHLGDCVDVYREIEGGSVGYSIFSPPFASLYTYSNSTRDMGNSRTDKEFFDHFSYLVHELFRVTIPGRSVSIHCANIPAMKERDGYIGLKDFRGDIIRLFESVGFIYHSEHVIWKDPLVEATRTKALGLMHKQLCKDSSKCRAGLPDYLVTMRKPGENNSPISRPDGFCDYIGDGEPTSRGIKYSHETWRKYASPVWMDIRQTRTLNYAVARDDKDERHICPLQLDVIERGITLWSSPGDLVSSPFAGIGSEGYCAVKMGRRFIGSELKPSYFATAVKNLKSIQYEKKQRELFT